MQRTFFRPDPSEYAGSLPSPYPDDIAGAMQDTVAALARSIALTRKPHSSAYSTQRVSGRIAGAKQMSGGGGIRMAELLDEPLTDKHSNWPVG